MRCVTAWIAAARVVTMRCVNVSTAQMCATTACARTVRAQRAVMRPKVASLTSVFQGVLEGVGHDVAYVLVHEPVKTLTVAAFRGDQSS